MFSVCQATLMMGIKAWERASQLDRKPSHRVLVGLGIFFFPQMEKSWHGAWYNKDLECSKKVRSGQGLTDGLKNSIIVVLEGVAGIRYYED